MVASLSPSTFFGSSLLQNYSLSLLHIPVCSASSEAAFSRLLGDHSSLHDKTDVGSENDGDGNLISVILNTFGALTFPETLLSIRQTKELMIFHGF